MTATFDRAGAESALELEAPSQTVTVLKDHLRATLAEIDRLTRTSPAKSELVERARALTAEFTADDHALATRDTHMIVPWRVVEATGQVYRDRPARFYITNISADHPCWQPQPLSAYSGLGVWAHDGATTRAYADAIARIRNNAGEVARVIRRLLHALGNTQQVVLTLQTLLVQAERQRDEVLDDGVLSQRALGEALAADELSCEEVACKIKACEPVESAKKAP